MRVIDENNHKERIKMMHMMVKIASKKIKNYSIISLAMDIVSRHVYSIATLHFLACHDRVASTAAQGITIYHETLQFTVNVIRIIST